MAEIKSRFSSVDIPDEPINKYLFHNIDQYLENVALVSNYVIYFMHLSVLWQGLFISLANVPRTWLYTDYCQDQLVNFYYDPANMARISTDRSPR